MYMKTIKYLSIILAASLALYACGDDPDDPNNPVPEPAPSGGKFLTKTYNMPAAGTQETIELTGLTGRINQMAGDDNFDWLTVTQEPYSSGTPKVTLTTADNTANKSRSAFVVFVAARDTLALTVRQDAYSGDPAGGTDVDKPNDSLSDQPAYARQR